MKSEGSNPLVLGIDTCGPSGSAALGRLADGSVEILEQIELEGRSYSATLVAAVASLLAHAGVELKSVGAIVAVNGPGSFTGVRVGLSAVKGLAEAAQIAVVAVSRLEVLAWKAGVDSAALDAHRHEVFLRLGVTGGKAFSGDAKGISESGLESGLRGLKPPSFSAFCGRAEAAPFQNGSEGCISGTDSGARELLAGVDELAALRTEKVRIAVCDGAAGELLSSAWPEAALLPTSPPTAADALKLCAKRVAQADFVDLALLDGNYLRRSDAEIFGDAARVHGA